MTRELTADEKAFASAVDSNGGYPYEAVIAWILSEDADEFHDGRWGEYGSSLTDLNNVFRYALEYARRK
jgi:proteasome lid subunit RPN8/RPN11